MDAFSKDIGFIGIDCAKRIICHDFVKALKSVDFPTLGNPTIPTGRYILQKQCSAEDAFLLKKDN